MISTPAVEAAAGRHGNTGVEVAGLLAPALPRLLGSILNDERHREFGPGGTRLEPDPATAIGEEGFGFDSLAVLGLVARLNRVFGLAETGIEDYLLVRQTFGDWVELLARHLEMLGPRATLTFSTSGTLGEPRDIRHSLVHLFDEAALHAARFFGETRGGRHLTDGRILAAVPPFHIYGFIFTVLVPGLAKRDVVDLTSAGPASAPRQARSGDLVIATPTIWAAASASGARFAPGVHGVTAGAPADEALWSGLRAAGLDSLTEIYGATETGGVGVREGPDAPFRLLGHMTRDGAGVSARDRPGRSLPLQDRLDWVDPCHFHLGGRVDDAVQVGGINVWPGAVARWLEQQPGVAAASVRLARGRLRAFVVPANPGKERALDETLKRAMVTALAPPERPVEITFGPDLPRSALGKPADWT